MGRLWCGGIEKSSLPLVRSVGGEAGLAGAGVSGLENFSYTREIALQESLRS